MNLLDAIQNCGDNWFRPTRMNGSGTAYKIKDGCVYIFDQPYID